MQSSSGLTMFQHVHVFHRKLADTLQTSSIEFMTDTRLTIQSILHMKSTMFQKVLEGHET